MIAAMKEVSVSETIAAGAMKSHMLRTFRVLLIKQLVVQSLLLTITKSGKCFA